MKYLSILLFAVLFASCSKDDAQCVARNAEGEALYEVVGQELCEDQVSLENGEYCDCEE